MSPEPYNRQRCVRKYSIPLVTFPDMKKDGTRKWRFVLRRWQRIESFDSRRSIFYDQYDGVRLAFRGKQERISDNTGIHHEQLRVDFPMSFHLAS